MEEPLIYVAVVDGKVSHIYSDQPLRFRVVAWDTEREPRVRMSSEARSATSKDKLVAELLNLADREPYDNDLLHGRGEDH